MVDLKTPVIGLPALRDNVIWLIPTGDDGLAVIDPSDAGVVLAYLDRTGRRLRHILLTHHHGDHTDGCQELAQRFPVQVIGGEGERWRLPPLDLGVGDGDVIPLGSGQEIQVVAAPGHTMGQVNYRFHDRLFTGDALFGFGCGRLFEGTAAMMWQSLARLRDLPGVVWIHPGHDYTLLNLRFAMALEPERPEWPGLFQELCQDGDAGHAPLPRSMAEQKRLNPFLRSDDPDFAGHLGLAGESPEAVFAWLRNRRDAF